jgi:hypothetical protein
MSIAQHIVIRFSDSRPLFVTLEERLRFSRTVSRIGVDFRVGGWGAGDDHAHAAALETRRRALELARRVEMSITKQLGLGRGFAKASVTEIRDQSHLRHSLPYMIGQAERHGVSDPFHDGSSLPDALGWRLLRPELPTLLAEVAPRVRLAALAPTLGPATPPDDAAGWFEAGVAALGVGHLLGRDLLAQQVRRAVVALACQAPTRQLAELLQCSPKTVRRLRAQPPTDEKVMTAVVAQARWRYLAKASEAA